MYRAMRWVSRIHVTGLVCQEKARSTKQGSFIKQEHQEIMHIHTVLTKGMHMNIHMARRRGTDNHSVWIEANPYLMERMGRVIHAEKGRER
jgi:hypothetical protein